MNFGKRALTPEQLDDLTLSGKTLHKTLSSLKWINSFFGNHQQLSKAVLVYCKKNTSKNKYHIVDLGCGGGDCIYFISKKLKQHDINASFIGIDGNPESISYANKQNFTSNQIRFMVADILHKDFSIPNCDLLICSHFIYHFDNKSLIQFLKQLKKQKVKQIIFSELYRSKIAYYTFKMIRYFIPISKMAKEDGLLAIQRSFSISELQSTLQQTNIQQFKIYKKPFFRMIVEIEP